MTALPDGRDPAALAQALIACRSVTPADAGATGLLGSVLAAAGFTVHRPTFSAPGTPDVANLYATAGNDGPTLAFAGHVDVVPPGDEAAWSADPFAGETRDGVLYGRGAVDMKGAVAAMIAAALRHRDRHPASAGRIAFLLTGDEEGPAINGTAKLLAFARERGARFDHCVLGEPTATATLGDTLKIGRRGSLNAILAVHGRQGHVAYPDRADNPIPRLLPMLAALLEPLDQGTAHFERSNLEIVSVDVGNPATNVIPATATARFNVRFNDAHTIESLKALIERRLAAGAGGARYTLDFLPGASASFITAPGPFVDLLSEAVAAVTGRRPALSTGGGTSDARFIKDVCPVVELGLVGTTMHQVDERVSLAELEALTRIYEAVLARYFSA
ncbi:MAG TPA: succinyl-diaminopimelate desuccinylase [Hyphomicrobiales bacterium]|nr:succinyl-diaminopimelate desuccinylase [Hyphomicrobiales bacterium]